MNDTVTTSQKEFVDYKKLPWNTAKIKFYNDNPDKRFGFVTLLDDKGSKLKDAYLSGAVLDKAGIYDIKTDDLVDVRLVQKEKGEACVIIRRHIDETKQSPELTDDNDSDSSDND